MNLSQAEASKSAAKKEPDFKQIAYGLSALLLLQILLAVYLHWGDAEYQPLKTNAWFIRTDFSRLSKILIESESEEGRVKSKLEFKKSFDTWIIPSYFNFPVSRDKLDGLISELKTFKKGYLVSSSESGAERYKVSKKTFERALTFVGKELVNNLETPDEKTTTLYLGASPSFKSTYARFADSKEIYTVPLSTSELSTKPEDWIDRHCLEFHKNYLRAAKLPGFELTRKGKDWLLKHDGKENTLSNSAVESLVQELSHVTISSILAVGKEAQGVDFSKPALKMTLAITTGKTLNYEFAECKDKSIYALRVDSKNYVYGVEAWQVDHFLEASVAELLKAQAAETEAKAKSGSESKSKLQSQSKSESKSSH